MSADAYAPVCNTPWEHHAARIGCVSHLCNRCATLSRSQSVISSYRLTRTSPISHRAFALYLYVPCTFILTPVMAARGRQTKLAKGIDMLKWALIFGVISVIAALFGFTGIAAGAAGIAKVLFAICLVVFVVLIVLAILGIGALS